MDQGVLIHSTAEVAENSEIGEDTRIWHQAQVMPDVRIGRSCTLGKGVFVGVGARIGDLVKIGNYANIFGAQIEDEVFIGPNACILQDGNPRSTNLDGTRKTHSDYTSAAATIQCGASIGASAIIMPGVTVGRWAMVSAGAVVNKDVPAHAVMVGNPARQVGYACQCGQSLNEHLRCVCGRAYRLIDTTLEHIDE